MFKIIKKSKYNAMVAEIATLKDRVAMTRLAHSEMALRHTERGERILELEAKCSKLESQLQHHDPKTGRFVKKQR